MKTITVQIGNSDDKLSQVSWSGFISKVDRVIHNYAHDIYFTGFSVPTAVWQNACWVFSILSNENSYTLYQNLKGVCREFGQDSIAWTEGTTSFING
jgi:hypothetical protein